MAVAKKKRVDKISVKEDPKKISDDPPEGTLDIFFGWLNERYEIKLPRLSECPAESVARDLLSKVIKYEKAPKHIMYLAKIEGKITVFENIILSGFMVLIEKKLVKQPKNRRPIIRLYGQ